MYIENNKNFDISLINVWDNEIKPYLIKQYPIAKGDLFTLNSDIQFIIKLIDSLKEEYGKNKIISENKNINEILNIDKNKDENKDKEKNSTNENNKKDKDIKEEEEETLSKSIQIESKRKRRGTETKIPQLENVHSLASGT